MPSSTALLLTAKMMWGISVFATLQYSRSTSISCLSTYLSLCFCLLFFSFFSTILYVWEESLSHLYLASFSIHRFLARYDKLFIPLILFSCISLFYSLSLTHSPILWLSFNYSLTYSLVILYKIECHLIVMYISGWHDTSHVGCS